MTDTKQDFTTKQLAFKELFVGTLIYVCVLGLLADYSEIVHAESFSFVIYAAFVLEVLTYFTLLAKKRVLSRLKSQTTMRQKALIVFGAWLILFLSKFVFIGVIDVVFMGTVTIYGFFNIFAVVLAVTVILRLTDSLFLKLGDDWGAAI